MEKVKRVGNYVTVSVIVMLMGCQTVDTLEEKIIVGKSILTNEKYFAIGEDDINILDLRQGYVSQDADTLRGNCSVNPVIVV